MIPWFILKSIDGVRPEEIEFIREEGIQKIYDDAREDCKLRGLDYEDLVHKDVFGDLGTSFMFMPCKYPYLLEEGVNHYVLWLNPIYDWGEDIDLIVSGIIEQIMGDVEFGWLENRVEDRSILGIRHFHIFFKNS